MRALSKNMKLRSDTGFQQPCVKIDAFVCGSYLVVMSIDDEHWADRSCDGSVCCWGFEKQFPVIWNPGIRLIRCDVILCSFLLRMPVRCFGQPCDRFVDHNLAGITFSLSDGRAVANKIDRVLVAGLSIIGCGKPVIKSVI